MLYPSLTHAIGNTPMVHLQRLSFGALDVYAKLEGQNPGGSVKDRTALGMITGAIERGELTEDKTIIEASSGNMGIALTWIGAHTGYRVCIAMSEGMSLERRALIASFGAELILTPKALGTKGAIEHVRAMVASEPSRYWFANQFHNPDNEKAHAVTGAEILADCPNIDYFFAGVATAGTIMA